jgi:hypothetical protein
MYWLQWHLHLQLLSAAEHARSNHVVLKGDLPIGVAKASADTWYNSELFRMDVGVGSPPDAFDPNGQNWGFPGMNLAEILLWVETAGLAQSVAICRLQRQRLLCMHCVSSGEKARPFVRHSVLLEQFHHAARGKGLAVSACCLCRLCAVVCADKGSAECPANDIINMGSAAGYNWERMAKDDYAWWRSRLSHMAQYFTAYRVDHILGFFRVYEVPARHMTGALGHFRPSQPLTRHQLHDHGLWDIERLVEPWATEEMLQEALEDNYGEVVALYFERREDGGLRLKPKWRNERDLAAISVSPDSPDWLVEVCRYSCIALHHPVHWLTMSLD